MIFYIVQPVNKLLIIEGDVNDGDIITSLHYFDTHNKEHNREIEVVEKFAALVEDFEQNLIGGHNFPMRERNVEGLYPELTEEELDIIFDLVPYMDNEQIHTIRSITLLTISDKQELL